MKSILLFLSVMFLSCFQSWAVRTVNDILELKEQKTHQYRLKTGMLSACVINMPFGGSEIISSSSLKEIGKGRVVKIELVYSNYPKEIDMKPLNLSRVKAIQRLRKSLVSNEAIEWKLIRQMACKNEAEAKVFFHGIVIHYVPEQSEKLTEVDLGFCERYLPVDEKLKSKKDVGRLMKRFPDTTVFAVLNRHKNWKNMTVVADLTGSMSPYVSQLVLWFKLNELEKRVENVTFFNDGDRTPDGKKVIGKIGGIYHAKAKSYKDVRELALKTIEAGFGGDWPENDFEAILTTIEAYPNAKEIVLIADNVARVRDYSLLEKIKIPVRVVLCGAHFGVNAEYLNLALRTGGSVHTIEDDLYKLSELSEGKIFELMGKKFRVSKGRIEEVRTI